MKPDQLFRLITPKNWTMSAVVGGSAAVAGDLIGFFSNLASPFWLVGVFGAALAVFGVLCVRKAMATGEDAGPAFDAVVECRECDGFRFSLFGTGVFLILALIGQGETVTERIARQLDVIEDNTTVTRDSVEVMREAMSSAIPVENPESAEAFYANAYIYLFHRQDAATAREALVTLYERFNPKKLDVADLYYQVAQQTVSPQQAEAEMLALGERLRDPSFAIILARYQMDLPRAEALREQALAIDPEHPYAIWDPARTALGEGSNLADPSGSAAYASERVHRIDAFLERAQARPTSDFFFNPQGQINGVQQAQTMRNILAQSAEASATLAAQRARQGR